MRRFLLVLLLAAAAAAAAVVAAARAPDGEAVKERIAVAEARLADVRTKITERSVEEEKCRREEQKVREHTGELSLEKSRLVKEYEFYNVPRFVADAERDLAAEVEAMEEDMNDLRIGLTLVESAIPILEEERLTADGRNRALLKEKIAEHRRRAANLKGLLAQARRDVQRARGVLGE